MASGMKVAPIQALGPVRAAVANRAGVVMLALMALALAYWLWIGLSWRSFHADDGTSILAIQGIIEHGYPLLPSGFVYYRGYVPNYLSAATSLLFGFNEFGIIFPSLIMGVGILGLVFLFARDVMSRPWIGVVTAALLLVLQYQASLSTSPRMYMALEFFAILSSYCAWQGYIRGRGWYQWFTFLALLGAVLSHDQSGALLVAVPLAVLAIRWIKGEEKPQINYLPSLCGLAILFSTYLLLYMSIFISLPSGLPQIALHSGAPLDRTGIHFELVNWLGHMLALEKLVPLSAGLSPLVALLLLNSYKNRHIEANQGVLYTFLIFFICGLITMSVIKTLSPRFWVLVLPVYAALLCASIVYAVSWFSNRDIRCGHTFATPLRSTIATGILICCISGIFLVFFLVLGPAKYLTLVKEGHGIPCLQGTTCSGAVKSQYHELKQVIQEDDVIISSNPVITNYYLGRVDGWFRERITPTGFTSFESSTDEYFGAQLVDSEEELNQLRDGDRRAWVIIDYKADVFSSAESLALIKNSYTKYSENGPMEVYVNSPAIGDH